MRTVRREFGQERLWVRWGEWIGPSSWQSVDAVIVDGPWLIVVVDGNTETWVPDHIVRGRVEIRQQHDRPAAER